MRAVSSGAQLTQPEAHHRQGDEEDSQHEYAKRFPLRDKTTVSDGQNVALWQCGKVTCTLNMTDRGPAME